MVVSSSQQATPRLPTRLSHYIYCQSPLSLNNSENCWQIICHQHFVSFHGQFEREKQAGTWYMCKPIANNDNFVTCPLDKPLLIYPYTLIHWLLRLVKGREADHCKAITFFEWGTHHGAERMPYLVISFIFFIWLHIILIISASDKWMCYDSTIFLIIYHGLLHVRIVITLRRLYRLFPTQDDIVGLLWKHLNVHGHHVLVVVHKVRWQIFNVEEYYHAETKFRRRLLGLGVGSHVIFMNIAFELKANRIKQSWAKAIMT